MGFLGLRRISFLPSIFFRSFGPSLSGLMANLAITKWRRFGELIFDPLVLFFLPILSQNHSFSWPGLFLSFFGWIPQNFLVLGETTRRERGGTIPAAGPGGAGLQNRSFSPQTGGGII